LTVIRDLGHERIAGVSRARASQNGNGRGEFQIARESRDIYVTAAIECQPATEEPVAEPSRKLENRMVDPVGSSLATNPEYAYGALVETNG
jgi:hypothetical protein